MGVGIYLQGTCEADEDALDVALEVAREHQGDDLLGATIDREANTLALHTHPAAQDIDLSFVEGRVTVSAQTSSVGPGYHDDVCSLCRALGERLGIAWDPSDEDEGTGDETGYFETGDRAALEGAMLRWLAQVARILTEQEGTGYRISMPMVPHYHGPPNAAVLTQLGPRDREWLDAVMADPRAALGFFPWWAPGKDAAYELGRVLVHLWMDVRYHAAATDDEERLGKDLLRRLGRAYRLDPDLAYPFDAWERLHDDVVDAPDDDLSEMVRRRARDDAERIGYRRHAIGVTLPGAWRITIPGSFSEQFENGAWTAWEDDRTVMATSYTASTPAAALPTTPREGTPTQLAELAHPHRAFEDTFEEGGETWWRIMAEIISGDQLLVTFVVIRTDDDPTWARRVIGGIRR